MKRLIPLGTAFVLVVTACGAGHKPAPQATNVSASVPPRSVHAIAVARRRAAAREAEKLLGRFVPPPGAVPLRRPPAVEPLIYGGLGVPEYAELVGRHRLWQVHAPFADVLAFVKAHRLRGFEWGGTAHSTGVSGSAYTAFDFDGPGHRHLTVTVVRLSGRTVLRVDAGAIWIYPRSPREVVPGGVRRIDVRAPGVSVRVTEEAKVARIVGWFDGLDIVQPGVTVRCGVLFFSPTLTLEFRSRRGALLAEAKAPSRGSSSLCNPTRFSIGGRARTPLMGDDFAARVERLLKIRVSSPR